MGNPHDSTVLDSVRSEIQETLRQGQHALEAFVDNRDDSVRLRFCLDHLHQVRGALRMVELFGAARLAEEMQAVAQALLNGTVVAPDDAIGVLMQAMLQLPQYLEQLDSCRDDFPLVLLPLLNDLRAARAQPLLAESSLFTPDLSPARFRARTDAGRHLQAPSVAGHLQKLRQMFQFAVAGITRQQELDAHFEYLDKVVMRLVKLCQQTPMGEIWLAAGALIDSLKARSNPVDEAIKALLHELDLQLKRLIDESVDVLQQPVAETLLTSILYYVARATDSDSPRIREVSERYRLADALPDDNILAALRQGISGPDRDTIHSVVGALNEELALLKDQLDLFARADSRQSSELSELLPGLQQIAGTLAILGLTVPHMVISAQVGRIRGLVDGSQLVDERVLLDIAGALLYAEATLNIVEKQPAGQHGQARGSSDQTSDNSNVSLSGPHLTDARTALAREARNSLEQVKSAIVAYSTSHCDVRELAEVPQLLQSIRCGLKLILLGRAVDVLAASEAFVREALIGGERVPERQQLNSLADVISSIEYYLERMAEGRTDNDAILDAAEKCLALLGFPAGAAPTWSHSRTAKPALEPEASGESDSGLVDEEILETFLEEAEEVLETIREVYPRFRHDPEALEALRDLRRAFHTLKGSGRLVGATTIGALGWAVENLLNRILEGTAQASGAVRQLLDDVIQRLPGLIDEFRNGQPASDIQEIIGRAEHLAHIDGPEVDDMPVLTEDPARERRSDAGPSTTDGSVAAPAESGESEPINEESLAVLVEECHQAATNARQLLPRFLEQWNDLSALTELRRAFHTLSGNGRLVGATGIDELAGSLENLLDRLIDGTVAMSDKGSQLLQDSVAAISALVTALRKRQPDSTDISGLVARARALSRQESLEMAAVPVLKNSAMDQADLSALEHPPQPRVEPVSVDEASDNDVTDATATRDDGVDPDLLEIFRSETETHLETLRQFLTDARQQSSSAYTDAVTRALHTLKGSANTARIEPIAKVIGPFENYVKTARAQNIRADKWAIALLQRLHDFIVEGLAQLEDSPQLELAGAEAFLGELDEFAVATLPQTTGEDDSAMSGPDARLVRIFLSDGMDILLDGDLILAEWSHSGQPGERLPQLEHELQKLALEAAAADLDDVSEVADVLFRFYSSGQQTGQVLDDEFFMQARAGHEHLLDLMDQVAAGLSTRPDQALVARLREQIRRFGRPAESLYCERPGADPEPGDHTLDESPEGHPDSNFEREAVSGETATGPDLPAHEAVHPKQDEEPDTELVDLFLAEAGDLVDHIGELLQHWKRQPEQSHLDQLRRNLGTVKSYARPASLVAIRELSHELEDLLEQLAGNPQAASDAAASSDLLLRSHDRLAAMVDSIRTGEAVRPAPDLIDEIQQYLKAEGSQAGLCAKVDGNPEAGSVPIPGTETPAPISAPENTSEEDSQDAELRDIFLEEANDLIDTSGELLQQWRSEPANTLTIRTLQRELHTLKGGARMAQIPAIADIAHEMEALFEAIAEGKLKATSARMDAALRGHDQLAASVETIAEQGGCPASAAVLAELRAVLQDKPGAGGDIPDPDECNDEQEYTPDQRLADERAAPAAGGDGSPDTEQIGTFLEKAHELVNSTASALYGWVENPDERAHAQALQQDMNTLKGGARTARISAIGDLSHILEDLFEAVVEGRLSFSPAMGDLLFKCHDALAAMVEQVTAGSSLESPAILIRQVEDLINGMPASTPSSTEPSLESTVAQDLGRLFLDEARDIESAIARSLEHWREGKDGSAPVIADLQSELHTLKGGARLADVDAVTELATFWDDRLQGLLSGDHESPATLALSERCLETLGRFLDTLKDGHKPSPLSARLTELVAAGPAAQEISATVDVEILEIFLEEADELVKALEQTLTDWHEDNAAVRFNQEAQRILHTLKGGARLVDAAELGNEAHRFESRLSHVQGSGEAPTEADWKAIDHCHDRLIELLEQVRQQYTSNRQGSAVADSPTAPPPMPGTQAETQLPAGQRAPTAEPSGQTQTAGQKAEHRQTGRARRKADAARAAQETIRVNAQLMDELVNLAGETSITRGRVEQQVSDFSHTLEDMVATIDRLREQLRRMEIETETQILFSAEKEYGSHYGDEFDPLEMDRYSSIQQLSRALGESASDLADLRETLAEKVRDAETLLLQQSRVNTELQEGLMKTRMVPFASVVPRLRRIVRQIGNELGKQVEFDVRNAEGELDRTVLERMVAPLEHMLRNALDHGIETVEDRLEAGKPGIGQIKLSLVREGGEVVLRMTDDGAGIPTAKVREKAIRNGLLQANDTVTDRDLLQFILQPGFSTAQSVTQISGRGVGMDVVASEIKQLGGSLDIDSVVGQGTTFTVHLPFTVSVNRALMVSTGEDLYAIPLNTIDGIVRVDAYELEEYYKPGSPPYEYAGQSYRLQYLGTLLHSEHQPRLQGQALPLPVILVRGADQPMALQVDSLLGSREIVVKPLGPQFGSVRGVSGATILGDGNVVVILDLPAMIRADILATRQRQLADVVSDEAHRSDVRATTVMVVDDSVTVRKVTSRLLERHGMEVLLAKDGLDAVAQLQDHLPDVILLDIEMPRMDGFEVASFIRYDARLKQIPIIMITSRTGSKHRQRATALGVNEYLGKPFQEQELLETIERLTD